ncbi:hypothetical protein Tco_0014291 [Tanacetum coccineum]
MSRTLFIAFIIRNVEITLRLEEFAHILRIPCRGVCVFTPEWAISSLPNGIDSNPDIYPPPLEDPLIIRDALFDSRPPSKTRKVKGVDVTLDPFQMVISELKTSFKIKYFNLAYYIVNRMVSVTKSVDMTLPYGIHLTRLVEHVRVSHPHAFSDDLYLVDHVMIHLSERRVFRIMPGEKRPRLPTPTPTPSGSSESTSSYSHQEEEIDPVNNFTLDPISYINQLPPIKEESYRNSSKPRECSSALVISYPT